MDQNVPIHTSATPRETSHIKLAIRAFREVVSAAPRWGILYPIFTNVGAILSLVQIYIFGRLIDDIVVFLREDYQFTIDSFSHSDAFHNFYLIIALYVFIAFCNKMSEYIQWNLTDEFLTHYRLKTMHQLSRMNLQDFEKREVQNLLANDPIYNQPLVLDTYFTISRLLYNMVTLVLASAFVVKEMAWWGVLVGLFVIPEAFYRYHYNVKLKQFRDSDTDRLKYFEYLFKQSTLPQNFSELRVDNVFSFFINSYKESAKKYFDQVYQIRFIRDGGAIFFEWFDSLFLRVAQMMLIPISIAFRYSIGTFKYLFDYIEKVYDSAWYVLWNSLLIKSNMLYVADYFAFADYQGFGDVASGTQMLDPLKSPRIDFQNISFSYPGSTTPIVSGLTFTIEPGSNVAIVGRDNSGKSTVAKLLCGLYEIGPGDILIDGISIRNLSRGELKNKISVVFETFIKYNFSIRKNITVAQSERDFDRRSYEEALEITGLDEWMKESGIDDHTILGKLFGNGIEISTGHWQRIAIARAIYRDRQILILDESLTQIDSFSRRAILERIIRHRPNQTFIHITQETEHLDLFNKVIRIEKGTIVNNAEPAPRTTTSQTPH
jgi:ABC-type multidrug transport system fused ATPase/permease subunit